MSGIRVEGEEEECEIDVRKVGVVGDEVIIQIQFLSAMNKSREEEGGGRKGKKRERKQERRSSRERRPKWQIDPSFHSAF